MQKEVNKLAIEIGSKFIENINDGKDCSECIEIIIAKDDNGDIGLSTQNSEITVFGLGGHQHFWSMDNKINEIYEMKNEIIKLLNNLVNGKIANAGFYGENDKPLCGGYKLWDGSNLFINMMPLNVDKVTVCIHKNIKMRIGLEKIIVNSVG